MRRCLVLTGLFVLALAANANAGWRIDRAEQIAAIVWHHPCNDHVPVTWATPQAADLDSFASAWVLRGDCTIYMSTAAAARQWEDVCTEILHEYGHLAGYRDPANVADPDHSLNQHSVMYGGIFREDDPRCAKRGRPFLVRHGLL